MSYWERRVHRRTALRAAAASGAAVAAMALVGCAPGQRKSERASGPVTTPEDTTARAGYGGILPRSTQSAFVSFEQSATGYSRLWKFTPAKYPAQPDGSMEGDAAQTWEISPDGLTTTLKIRDGLRFDPRLPTNNRPVTAEDIVFSWNRFSSASGDRDALVNKLSPNAAVAAVSALDSRTVQIKTAFPYAALAPVFGFRKFMLVWPAEGDRRPGGFDIRSATLRGSGGWTVPERGDPTTTIQYRKNPDWYDARKVYFDGFDYTILPEYDANVAQFRAGNTWLYPNLKADDLISVSGDLPALSLHVNGPWERSTNTDFRFGSAEGSPFRDERVRQAISLLTDRNAWIDSFYNVRQFHDRGMDLPLRWNSPFAAGESFWLDPEGRDLGEAARWYRFDPGAAKQLLRAAGHTSTIQTPLHYNGDGYGISYRPQLLAAQAMWEQYGDFKFQNHPVESVTEWEPVYNAGSPNAGYVGMAASSVGARPDIDLWLQAYARYGSSRSIVGESNPQLESLLSSQARELDSKKRAEILKAIQRLVAGKMYWMLNPGQSLRPSLAWPQVANYGLYTTFDQQVEVDAESNLYLWYDESKRPA